MTEQRTPEWFQARVGKLTASRIADATARTKSDTSRNNYMGELWRERLTGQPYPQYTNAAMQRGTELESEACTVYEFERNVKVEECGFIPHPHIPMSGASPDGLVDMRFADGSIDMGLVEFKCPSSPARHDAVIFNGKKAIDERYIKQMQWQMACTNRQWCDFVSYDPTMAVELRMIIIRVARDDKMIAKLETEAEEFLAELALRMHLFAVNRPAPRDTPVGVMEQLRQSAVMS